MTLSKCSRVAASCLVAIVALTFPAIAEDGASAGKAETETAATEKDKTRIITLGTLGGPRAYAERSGSANLLMVGDRAYLIDAGPGVSHQLAKAGLQPVDVNKIFLTHLHFDHVQGLAALLGFNWVRRSDDKVDIYGPPATSDFVKLALAYLDLPLRIYMAEMPPTPPVTELATGHDIDVVGPTVVYEDDKVRVSAVENSHYATIPESHRPLGAKRSYSYRFDTPDRSIVFTGDTGPSAALEELAKDADVLVTEIMDMEGTIALQEKLLGLPREKLKPVIDHMLEEHLAPEAVGRIAANSSVKKVVLTHLGPGFDGETDMEKYTDGVREFFSGDLVIAHDGAEF